MVMLAVMFTGRASATTTRVYGGEDVAYGAPIALQLNSRGDELLEPIGRITYGAGALCPDGLQHIFLVVNLPIVTAYNVPDGVVLIGDRRPGDRFDASGVRLLNLGGATGLVRERIAFRRVGSSVSGSYRGTVEVTDGDGTKRGMCETGVLRWRARSAPRRIFAGATSAGYPVVMTLDRRRRRVQHMRLGAFVNCGPGVGEPALHTFSGPLRPGGRFTDGDSYSLGDEHGRDSVSGQVRGTRAHGTFRDRFTTLDSKGERVSCDSGRIGWRARSSPRGSERRSNRGSTTP